MRPLNLLLSILPLSTALPASTPKLIILDAGANSYPDPRWQTSLRALTPAGTDATILRAFGEVPLPDEVDPTGAYSLAYSASTSSLFLATGAGIIRTTLNGSDSTTITVPGSNNAITAVAVAETAKKVYYGTMDDGCIRRANFDGSGDELFRNVSQGINSFLLPDTVQANSYPSGVLVDEERGWVYWSAWGEVDGSIRRVPMQSGSSTEEEEILVSELNMPGQLRILGDEWLYWVEQGFWGAIKRVKLPGSKVSDSALLSTEVVVDTDRSDVFTGVHDIGATTKLSISSFAFGEAEKKLWFVAQRTGYTIFGKLVETGIDGGELKVLTANTSDVGVPVGLEYIE
jgi:hypothetical protein